MNHQLPDTESGEELKRYVADRIIWLTRLRWMALIGIVSAVALARALHLIWDTVPFYVVAALLGAYNLFFWNWGEEISERATARSLENIVFYQMLADMVSLAVLVHYAGGMQNPFVMFFVFHAAIGAMMLPLRRALALGSVAWLLHGGTVLAEALGLIAHRPLWFSGPLGESLKSTAGFPYPASWVAGYLAALGFTVFGVIYFVYSVASRQRRAEAERDRNERIALSRERLARIGEIAAGVAHNIRNPLHGMRNCVELLQARHGSEESSSELLELLSEGFSRIRSVVDRLLDLTQDRSPVLRETDLNELVRETLRLAEINAREKDLQLDLKLRPVPPVTIDSDRLAEALLNVLHNAFDASPRGAPVTVETRTVDDPESSVEVEVRDEGTGIPPEELPHIFDPFFSTKDIGQGTGLGLSIARRVLDEHGVTVRVDSDADAGTRVCFRLPRSQESVPEGETAARDA